MAKNILVLILSVLGFTAASQSLKTENIIIVALDGYRWQEVFRGADSEIIANREFTNDEKTANEFIGRSHDESRKLLMPFLWTVVAENGQIYGNRDFGNQV